MDFEIVGPISNIEVIAVTATIRVYRRLERAYGRGRWRKLKGEARVRLLDGWMVGYSERKCTGMKRTASAEKSSRSNGSSTRGIRRSGNARRFVVCVRNGGYRASLELRKLYEVLPDERAAKRHYLRVRDESGEDYLFPEAYFVPLELTTPLKKALLRVS